LTDARIQYEEARLNPNLDPERFEQIADEFYTAENQYWENRHEREEAGTWFVRYDVNQDDMGEV